MGTTTPVPADRSQCNVFCPSFDKRIAEHPSSEHRRVIAAIPCTRNDLKPPKQRV